MRAVARDRIHHATRCSSALLRMRANLKRRDATHVRVISNNQYVLEARRARSDRRRTARACRAMVRRLYCIVCTCAEVVQWFCGLWLTRTRTREDQRAQSILRACMNVFVFTVCGMCARTHTYIHTLIEVECVTQSPVQCCGLAWLCAFCTPCAISFNARKL